MSLVSDHLHTTLNAVLFRKKRAITDESREVTITKAERRKLICGWMGAFPKSALEPSPLLSMYGTSSAHH